MAREKVYVFGHQKPDTDTITSNTFPQQVIL